MRSFPIGGSTDMRMLRFIVDAGTITFEIVAPPFEAEEEVTPEEIARLATGHVPGTTVAAVLDRYREFRATGDPLNEQGLLAIEAEVVAAAGQVSAALDAAGTESTRSADDSWSGEATSWSAGPVGAATMATAAITLDYPLLLAASPVPVPREPGGQLSADESILPADSWLRIGVTMSQKSGLHIQVETQREPAPPGDAIAATGDLIGRIEASLMAVALPHAPKLLASKVIKGTLLLQRHATELRAIVAWERLGLRLHHGRFDSLSGVLAALPRILADLDRQQDQPLPRFIRPGDAEKRALAPSTAGANGAARPVKAAAATAKASPPLAPALAALAGDGEVLANPPYSPGAEPASVTLPPAAPMPAPVAASQEGAVAETPETVAATPDKVAQMPIPATVNLLDFLEE